MTKVHILVVDDERDACQGLAFILQDEGYRVTSAFEGESALTAAASDEPEVALVDVRMPGMDGLELLRHLKRRHADTSVVMVSGHGTIETAVQAMKEGADDYICKPVNVDELLLCLKHILERRRLAEENAELRRQLGELYSFENIVGNSPPMQRIFKAVEQVATTDATVMVVGETGTGKELICHAIHNRSRRKDAPFVTVNCAALSESILESELFGHEKGAFTGADRRRKGRFERADGGTLFLDEITEIGNRVQVKLLRFLEQREVERVGAEETFFVDVRIVAATNRDIDEAVRSGMLRQDLYYRLNVVRLHLPPLRERKNDIPALALHFLRKYAEKHERQVAAIAPEAMAILMDYLWPGNVREIKNVIEQAIIFARDEQLKPADVAPLLQQIVPDSAQVLGESSGFVGETLEDIEREAILKTLAMVDGDRKRAAEILKVSERTIYRRISELKKDSSLQVG